MRILLVFLLTIPTSFFSLLYGQCPTIVDGLGTASNNPYYIGCSGSDLTIYVQPTAALGQYTINWGDGTPDASGNGLVPPNYETHTYSATVDTFNITITDISTGCVINGVAVLEEPVNASIQIPLGGVTQTCAPSPIDFINSSTDVSPTTTFTWNFGDGSPPLTFGPGNAGQTLSHTYQKYTVNCNTTVTLTAENYCSFGSPTSAQFSPIQIYDVDDAAINASAQMLCYPDTVVTFTNATQKNCLPQGNVQQRYEYWNLGDYWGLGYDSIINWQPFDPPVRPGHTIAFPGIGSYSIMMIDSNMCGQDTAYITVQVVPPPTAAISSNKDTICAGDNVTFYNNSTGAANMYVWNYDQGNGWQNQGPGNKTRTFNNQGTYQVGLAVGINGASVACRDTAYVPLVVEPSPIASFQTDINSGCDSIEVNFTENSQNVNQWSWNFGNGNTDSNQVPNSQFYNSSGIYNITLQVTHPNGCVDSQTQQVQVYESPQAAFLPNNVCQQSLAQFTDLSTSQAGDPLVNWSWSFGDGGTSSIQNPTHAYSASGSYPFELIVNTANCADTILDTLIVEPKPVSAFQIDVANGCSPLTVNYTNNSTGAATYQWNFGDSSVSTDTNTVHTYFNNQTTDTTFTTYLIAESTFGCRDTSSQVIDVFGIPQSQFSFNTPPACGPMEVPFTNSSIGANQYLWNFGDTSGSTATHPTHVYQNQTLFITNYNASLVAYSANGCTDTSNQLVTVYPEPIFPFSSIPDSGCAPLEVTFPALVGAVQYQWDFGDGTIANGQQPTHIFTNNTTNNQVYNVQLIATSSFGCSDTTYEDVIVYPNPIAGLSINTNAACSPAQITIENQSTGANFYSWYFGDGDTSTSSSAIIQHTYQNSGTATLQNNLTLLVETAQGCIDTVDTTISIYPEVHYQINDDTASCEAFVLPWNATGSGATTFNWTFGDGGTANTQNPVHTYHAQSTTQGNVYQSTLFATSAFGCADTQVSQITVYPKPDAQFQASVQDGCSPLPVNYTNNSTGVSVYNWNFGDGSFSTNAQVGTHVYLNKSNSVTYNYVELLVQNNWGCSDTARDTITVYPEVEAQISPDTNGCHPLVMSFSNSTQGASTYQWDFGNGNTSNLSNPTEVFNNFTYSNQNFQTVLTATSQYGCVGLDTTNITVYPKPSAAYAITSTTGCSPFEVTLQNNSSGANSYYWTFGDGTSSISSNPSFSHLYQNQFASPQQNLLTLVASTLNGCTDTTSQIITVNPEVIAAFTSDTIGCSELETDFVNQSSGAHHYTWDFGNGNGSTQVNPDETFSYSGNTFGVYQVKLFALSNFGCRDTAMQNITVYPTPNAAFNVTPVTQVYPSATVSVLNQTVGNWQWNWDFGDGTNSSNQYPSAHTYSSDGDYTIVLTISNDYCSDTLSRNIEILPPPPVAAFVGSGEGCAPLTISFDNQSEHAQLYMWEFGDGNMSNLLNPTYTYYQPGIYTVRLTAIGANGQDVVIKVDSVVVNQSAVAYFDAKPNEVSVPGEAVQFFNLSSNSTSWTWDFGDGNTSNEQLPNYYYQLPGEYNVTLIANNEFDCPDTFTLDLPIIALAEGEVQFPNAFTPTDGGSTGGYYTPGRINNDIFHPMITGADEYHLMIYNRWGEMVFETYDQAQGWDGYYKGQLCQQDAYVWKAEVAFINGDEKVFVGDVTLIR